MSSTRTVRIQRDKNTMRPAMFSAPVRSTTDTCVLNEQQRVTNGSTSYHGHLATLPTNSSTVSIYDLSILLTINRKLADDYKLDSMDPLNMCETNRKLTEKMAKDELAQCWRLLAGLVRLQSVLPSDHVWFQTPIALGKQTNTDRRMLTHRASIHIA
jgi:hypothetical protein